MRPRFPVAFRLSAFAFWVILRPLGDSAFLTVGLPRPLVAERPGPHRGCRVEHEQDATGQGALFTPGTVMRSRPATILRPAPAASQRPVPIPRSNLPPPGATFTKRHRGFTHVHPSPRTITSRAGSLPTPTGLLLACVRRMERQTLGFYPELRTPHSPATHVEAETGRHALARVPRFRHHTEAPTAPPTSSHAPSLRTQP